MMMVGVVAAGAASSPGDFSWPSFSFHDPDMASRSCGATRTYTADIHRANGVQVDSEKLSVVNCGTTDTSSSSDGSTTTPTTTPPPAGVSPIDYGANPADAGDDTAGFQKAIDAASTGDGVVSVPTGTWRVYGLDMKSNVTMQIEAGAVLTEYGASAG